MAKKKEDGARSVSHKNRKAFHLYTVLEKYEAGIALVGSEVKSIRAGDINFGDAYVRLLRGEAWLESLHIGVYAPANRFNHEPMRKRKLLLHKQELLKLESRIREKGLTLVPLAIYTKSGKIKLELGLCRGKKLHDKRDDMQKRDAKREMERAVKGDRGD